MIFMKNKIPIVLSSTLVLSSVCLFTASTFAKTQDYDVIEAQAYVDDFLNYYTGSREERGAFWDTWRETTKDDPGYFDFVHYSTWAGGSTIAGYQLCYELLSLQEEVGEEMYQSMWDYLAPLPSEWTIIDGYNEYLVYKDMLKGFTPEVIQLSSDYMGKCVENLQVTTVNSVQTQYVTQENIYSYDEKSEEYYLDSQGVDFIEGIVTLEIHPYEMFHGFEKADFDNIWEEVWNNPEFSEEEEKYSAYLQASIEMLMDKEEQPSYSDPISYDLVVYTGNKIPYKGKYQVREMGENNAFEFTFTTKEDGVHAPPEMKLNSALYDFSF